MTQSERKARNLLDDLYDNNRLEPREYDLLREALDELRNNSEGLEGEKKKIQADLDELAEDCDHWKPLGIKWLAHEDETELPDNCRECICPRCDNLGTSWCFNDPCGDCDGECVESCPRNTSEGE